MWVKKAERNARTPERASRPAPAGAKPVRAPRTPWRQRIRAWQDQHLYSLFSSLGKLVARPWATAFTVLVLGVALALPVLFYLVFDNARGLSGGLREAREVTVFLKPALDAAEAQKFQQQLRSRADVADVVLRTPEQGLAEFRQLSGVSEALEVLQNNPLPSVLVVIPLPAAGEEPVVLGALQQDARVDLVQYDAAWRRRLNAILSFAERIVLVLAVVLSLATLLVVGNTVRLDIQGRAEEIAVMQLIGASNGFIRRPFLYAGFWYGLLGGLLAVLAVGAVEWSLAAPVERLLSSYEHRFALRGIGFFTIVAVVAASAALGWLGALVASARHLARGHLQE